MDAFESVVMRLFEEKGYWVRPTYKVCLTPQEKRHIGRHSCPRWEIDLVAYRPIANEILILECKSYLDSPGVRYQDLNPDSLKRSGRYKLFTEPLLREVVCNRLAVQMEEAGLCAPLPSVKLGLAAGKVCRSQDRIDIQTLFDANGWLFYHDQILKADLRMLAQSGYENCPILVATKLMTRA